MDWQTGLLKHENLLRRDGSVFTAVSLSDLAQPDVFYKKLGCKLAVGMPFKDIASSDTLFMRQLPPSSDVDGRRTLVRLQEVGMHVIAPLSHLVENPMKNAVALVPLREAVAAPVSLPEGCKRCVHTHHQRFCFQN